MGRGWGRYQPLILSAVDVRWNRRLPIRSKTNLDKVLPLTLANTCSNHGLHDEREAEDNRHDEGNNPVCTALLEILSDKHDIRSKVKISEDECLGRRLGG